MAGLMCTLGCETPNHGEPPAILLTAQCEQMQDPTGAGREISLRSAIGGALRNQEFRRNLAKAGAATSRTSGLV